MRADTTPVIVLNIETMDGDLGLTVHDHKFVSVDPHSPRRLSLYVIEVTQQCNFRCRYCCYSGEYNERRVHNPLVMNETTAKATIDFIIATNCPDRDVRITFYGGEALLAFPLVKSMVESLYGLLKERVEFAISTNGLLLNREIINWICSYPKFKVYVSIDSYEELHDRNRITVVGLKTFNRIIRNLECFSKLYHEEYIQRVFFLVTLTSWDELPEASRQWQDSEVLKHRVPIHLSFVMPRNVDDVLHAIDDVFSRRKILDVALEQYELGLDNLLTSKFKEWTNIVNRDSQTLEEETVITVITCVEDFYRTFISAEGDIYICERFSKHFKIGTVFDGIIPYAAEEIEKQFIGFRNKRCKKCEIANVCSKCMTILNYESDIEMLDAVCDLEIQNIKLLKEYAWKRRQSDRKRSLLNSLLGDS